MKRLTVSTPLVAVAALCLTTHAAAAEIVLDHVSDAYDDTHVEPVDAEFQTMLQTLSVGVGGALARVELQVQQNDVNTPCSVSRPA